MLPINNKPLLHITDLTIAYRRYSPVRQSSEVGKSDGDAWLEAVRDFSLQIEPGQTYGLVGESGSGKSTLALTIMRHLAEEGMVCRGKIMFDGQDLLSLSRAKMRRIWGKDLSLVPQDPLSSLNPSIRIGEQLAEGLRQHQGLSHAAAAARATQLLDMVRVPDPQRVSRSYPHELSGGMQQRVLIAMALSAEPKLLVLDEPTTSLDVTTQAAVLDLFSKLMREHRAAALYVTHNLGVVARICDRVAVLYAGELVEDAPTMALFQKPLHPYTQGLLNSVPKLGQKKEVIQLQVIPGRIPALGERHTGCVFAPRCPLAVEKCFQERPPLAAPFEGQRVRCHRWSEIAAGEINARQAAIATNIIATPVERDKTVLNLQEVNVYFDVSHSLIDTLTGQSKQKIKVVDGVNLSLSGGHILGLVGESGSGKTTLARAVIGLVELSGGEIELLDFPLPPKLSQRNLQTLRHLQYVFQNPEEALNPYLTISEALSRPFITLLGKSRQEAELEAKKLLTAVRLPAEYTMRLPNQLSGGEKQRIAIARAFATSPDLLVADEPVSSLDVSVQASILNLLGELQAKNQSAMLFISHDLAVVRYLADQIAVIYLGKLMEVAGAADLFQPPFHPYTEALLSAIPLIDPSVQQKQIRLEGDGPSQIEVPSGCPFHPRCPRFLGDICVKETPPWRGTERGKRIFCHIPLEELRTTQQDVVVLEQS